MPSTSLRFVALLRGVNVGGHRRVPMQALRAALERAGLENVRTYIQSGNVLFSSADPHPAPLIAHAIQAEFGVEVPVLLRRAGEWRGLAAHNPYPAQADADGTTVHVAFLAAPPDPAHLQSVRARVGCEWALSGRDLYLHTPMGLGQSDLRLGKLEGATVRNWRTVQVISALLDA